MRAAIPIAQREIAEHIWSQGGIRPKRRSILAAAGSGPAAQIERGGNITLSVLYRTTRHSFKINLAKKCREEFSVVGGLFFCRRKTRKIKDRRAPAGGATE
jgi:hypothetical protein